MSQDTDKKSISTNNLNNKIESAAESLDKGIEGFADSIEKEISKLSNCYTKGIEIIDDKISHFDDERFEKNLEMFFIKLGRIVVTFLTVILPQLIRKIIAFFKFAMQRLRKIIDSNSWGILVHFLFIIIALGIIVTIATCLRGCMLR